MNPKHINKLIELLESKSILFAKGLTDDEIQKIKIIFDIEFPADLKLLLQTALPISQGFAQWRSAINSRKEKERMQNRLNRPLEGMLFDVQYNDFWMPSWGEKPKTLIQQKAITTQFCQTYPKLIPIYAHRFLPQKPCVAGNPVLSVYQMDIIYYGYDLADYLAKEFRLDLPGWFGKVEKPYEIEFWSQFC